MAVTFLARYVGECRTCPEPIEVGDRIRTVDYASKVYVHADCPDPRPEPDPLATDGLPYCGTCFMYHRGDCP